MDYEKKYKDALARAEECRVKKHFNETDDTLEDICEYIFPELAESEDEKIRKFLVDLLSHGTWKTDWPFSPVDCVAWLEKQKEQKPAEWSEEGTKRLDEIAGYLQYKGREDDAGFIKSLRPQPRQEWSDADEDRRRAAIKVLANNTCIGLADWLKSLRSKPHWKPSKEQIEALQYATGNGGRYNKVALESLYNDLKKL